MVAGDAEATPNRLAETLDRANHLYELLNGYRQSLTPYVVRTAEVILTVGLLVFLARWGYMFYTA